jgi:nitrate/nitrite transporter NarK
LTTTQMGVFMAETSHALQFGAQHPSMFRSWLVVLSSALFFFYIFIQMNLFNAISVDLVKEFHFNADQIGYLGAFYFYGNVLFLFPAGMLLDRFSVRALLFIVFLVSIVATYVFSATSIFWVMNASRLAIGLAGAFAFVSAVKLASRWFDPRHMALVIGVVVTMAMIGGAVAQTPLALLSQKIGWRGAMQVVVALGAILVLVQLFLVRDEPKGLEKVEDVEHKRLEKTGFWSSLGATLSNMQNWLSGLYISLVNLPLFILGGIWGVPYLTQAHNLNQVQATEVTTMLFIGMMIGSPLSGVISDKLGLRKLPMIVGAVLSLIAASLIVFTTNMPFWVELAQFFFLGLVMGSQVIGYPVIAESNSHSITATATSVGSTLIMAGGILVQTYGWLLDFSGKSAVAKGVIVYSRADFTRANSLMLVGLVIALLASLLIKETYCKPLE